MSPGVFVLKLEWAMQAMLARDNDPKSKGAPNNPLQSVFSKKVAAIHGIACAE